MWSKVRSLGRHLGTTPLFRVFSVGVQLGVVVGPTVFPTFCKAGVGGWVGDPTEPFHH